MLLKIYSILGNIVWCLDKCILRTHNLCRKMCAKWILMNVQGDLFCLFKCSNLGY